MTVERRLVVGLKDIVAVTFECQGCKARLTLPVKQVNPQKLTNCPPCGQQWLTWENFGHADRSPDPLYRFVGELANATEVQGKTANVLVLFEFEEPRV